MGSVRARDYDRDAECARVSCESSSDACSAEEVLKAEREVATKIVIGRVPGDAEGVTDACFLY